MARRAACLSENRIKVCLVAPMVLGIVAVQPLQKILLRALATFEGLCLLMGDERNCYKWDQSVAAVKGFG